MSRERACGRSNCIQLWRSGFESLFLCSSQKAKRNQHLLGLSHFYFSYHGKLPHLKNSKQMYLVMFFFQCTFWGYDTASDKSVIAAGVRTAKPWFFHCVPTWWKKNVSWKKMDWEILDKVKKEEKIILGEFLTFYLQLNIEVSSKSIRILLIVNIALDYCHYLRRKLYYSSQ